MKLNINIDKLKNSLEKEKNVSINDDVLIIDGSNRFISSFSVSTEANLSGKHVGGYTTFLLSIGRIIRELNPSRVIITFDGKGGSRKRKKIFNGYKNNRNPNKSLNKYFLFGSVDEENKYKAHEFERLLKYLDNLPVTIISIDYIEADDVISYICSNCKYDNITIVSSDRDFLQLVSNNVNYYEPIQKKFYVENYVKEKYSVHPKNFINYKILMGDISDNVKGVNGIGKKSIEKLNFLKESTYYSFNDIISKKNNINSKIIEKIEKNKEIYDINYEIMSLSNIELSMDDTIRINNLYNNVINDYNPLKIKTFVIKDQIEHVFQSPERWLENTFYRLDKIKKRSLGE